MSKRETTLPHIDPGVTAPRAAAYRQALSLRKSNNPVAGGPTPPLPDLTQEPPADSPPMTMSEHAMRARAQSINAAPSILNASPFGGAPFGPQLLQNDLLPEAAKQDPAYHEGAGAAYAINQPHLALKYGVLRQGNHIPPQALVPQRGNDGPKLSEKTIKGLEEVAKFQQQRQAAESRSAGDVKAEREAASGSAAAAAKIGNMPGDDSPNPISEQERRELASAAIRKMDDFDFDTFRQMMMKDLINNPEQKEIIEERLKPMDIGDLIVDGYVKQEVVIIPGRFWVEFRSVSAEEDLAVKRLLMQEAKAVSIDDRYYLDKFAFMTLTLGLNSICGNPCPSHLVDGRFNEDAFWKKYEFVTRLNTHMIASLGVNYFWFDIRVRKLVVAERIKNG